MFGIRVRADVVVYLEGEFVLIKMPYGIMLL